MVVYLHSVANHHQQNLMTVANLGVVFGPTLLRPQEETVAAIMDIKFQNIVVELLIENHEKVGEMQQNSGTLQRNSALYYTSARRQNIRRKHQMLCCCEVHDTLVFTTEKSTFMPVTFHFMQCAIFTTVLGAQWNHQCGRCFD